MGMSFEYIKNYYGVPAEIGRRVTVDGKQGVIAEDLGSHIGVRFDGENTVVPCHQAWRVIYGNLEPLFESDGNDINTEDFEFDIGN